MKPFAIWLVIALILFGGLSGFTHYRMMKNPEKILVAVDTSYPMKDAWHNLPEILKKLEKKPYSVFCLVSEKHIIRGWSDRLDIGKITPYAPRDFSKLIGKDHYPEIDKADKKILITTALPGETENFRGWEIIRIQ